MNIGIDIRSALKAQTTGIGYYTLNLIRHLAGVDTENKYNLYCRRCPGSRKKRLPALPGKNFRHLVNFLGLPDRWFLKDMDVFHSSAYDLLPKGKVRKIITIHDLIPRIAQETGENWHPSQVISGFDFLIKNVLRAADKIIVTSHNTKNDLIKYYAYDSNKITVIPMGVSPSFAPVEKEQKDMLYKNIKLRYNITTPYLLYVGTIEPRKNITGLIAAYNLLKKERGISHKLIVSGMKGWMCNDVFQMVEQLKLNQDVIFTGYVSYEDMRALYSLAEVFIYPSLYEGFGLPLLEAMACGVPVVASDSGALAEVAGEAAVLCRSKDPRLLAEGVGRVLDDRCLADELVKKGLQRAKMFSWQRTAEKTLSLYQQCLS